MHFRLPSQRIIKRCPHCQYRYLEKTISEPLYLYGSPIITCQRCKKNFIDTDFHEAALTGVRERDLAYKQKTS